MVMNNNSNRVKNNTMGKAFALAKRISKQQLLQPVAACCNRNGLESTTISKSRV